MVHARGVGVNIIVIVVHEQEMQSLRPQADAEVMSPKQCIGGNVRMKKCR